LRIESTRSPNGSVHDALDDCIVDWVGFEFADGASGFDYVIDVHLYLEVRIFSDLMI